MGRPSKCTPERCGAILQALRNGCTRTAAASVGGVDLESLRRWMARSAEFRAEVTHAEAEAERVFTEAMRKAAVPHTITVRTTTTNADGSVKVVEEQRAEFDWRAAEAWLKRRRRAEWGDNQDVTSGGQPIGAVPLATAVIHRDEPTYDRDPEQAS